MLSQPAASVALPTTRDTDEIGALFARLMQALNDHDATLMDGVFSADLMLVDADGRRLNDWKNARSVFGELFRAEVPTWTMSCRVLRIVLVDRDVAVVNTMHHLATPTSNLVSNVTSVAVRRNGRWWIASSHSGPFAPSGA